MPQISCFSLAPLFLLLLVHTPLAAAQNLRLSPEQANWRTEISLLNGIPSTNFDRKRDLNLALVLDYEMPFITEHPLLQRSTFSFRGRPLMFHHQEVEDNYVYAVGAGVAVRVFQKAETHTGLFVELAEELLLHSRKFAGNSTHFNFLTQAGLGYQWSGGGFVGMRYQHASNARLGNRNSGIDTWGAFGGFRF